MTTEDWLAGRSNTFHRVPCLPHPPHNPPHTHTRACVPDEPGRLAGRQVKHVEGGKALCAAAVADAHDARQRCRKYATRGLLGRQWRPRRQRAAAAQRAIRA
eukprot:364212-Chlamydomonas_euryale.AAC.1